MGLSGAGKTTLATLLESRLAYKYFNADIIRKKYDDWDFSAEGRRRQTARMKFLASEEKNCICDFICPTEELRELFEPDFIIWMDTIKECKYEDTTALFQPPEKYDIRISSFEYSIEDIVHQIKEFKHDK